MNLRIEAVCDKGPVREANEDMISIGGLTVRDSSLSMSLFLGEDSSFCMLVSDGMGGHDKGEEASAYALASIKDFISSKVAGDDAEEALRVRVAAISDELNAMAAEEGQSRPMGCTMTGLVIAGGKTLLLNVGDSRTYRLRDGILRCLTSDHTVRALSGNPSDPKTLVNCIGAGIGQAWADILDLSGRLLPGDRLLLCSDGLTDMVPDDVLERETGTPGSSARDLADLAVEAGGADNISVVVADIF